MIRAAIAAAFALMAAAQAASAALVPRSEAGSVMMAMGAVAAGGSGLAQPGDAVITRSGAPADWVRLIADAPPRLRPGKLDAIPAGTALFAVQLSTGAAYCAPFDVEKAIRRTACLRDFDADGVFDGAYLTLSQYSRSGFMVGRLHALTSVSPTPFAPAPDAAPVTEPISLRFVGWRGETARFAWAVGEERLATTHSCTPDPDGQCVVADVILQARRQGGALAFTVAEPSPAGTRLLVRFTDE